MNPYHTPVMDLFSIMLTIVFVLMIGIIIYRLYKEITQSKKNHASPRLCVEATVVAKRQDVRIYHVDNDMGNRARTKYYVTFQVESGDRMEFAMKGTEYGLLVEGDKGKLSFQGTKYEGFERTIGY